MDYLASFIGMTSTKAKRTFLVLTIIYLLAFSLGLNFAYQLFQSLEKSQNSLNWKNRLLNGKHWVLTDREWRKINMVAQEHHEKALQFKHRGNWVMYVMVGGALIYFIFCLGLMKTGLAKSTGLASGLAIIALTFWMAGILLPTMELSAYVNNLEIPIQLDSKDVLPSWAIGKWTDIELDYTKEFPGEMYFFHQSKSILGVIDVLIDQGNYFVAGCLLLFSLVFPLLKLMMTIWTGVSNKTNIVMDVIIHKLGKWSMADVFVVALFLAMMSFNQMETGVQTRNTSHAGLVFFTAFVVLSLFSSHFLAPYYKKPEHNG